MRGSIFRRRKGVKIQPLLTAIVLVPILTLIGTFVWVYNANNAAAQHIEERLLALEMPEHSELVDSSWMVSRFAGAGNGTHQAGALLLHSNLNPEALETFYEAQPGEQRVIALDNGESLGRESMMFKPEYDLSQPGLFMIFAYVEPTSVLLHDFDIRGK